MGARFILCMDLMDLPTIIEAILGLWHHTHRHTYTLTHMISTFYVAAQEQGCEYILLGEVKDFLPPPGGGSRL
jgi:hypothetical protein